MQVMKDLELNNDIVKSIWHFYQIYQISANFLGINDPYLKDKNKLIIRMIINPDNLDILNKLKDCMAQDSKVIEMALGIIETKEDENEVFEDFYPDSIFAVNIDDR